MSQTTNRSSDELVSSIESGAVSFESVVADVLSDARSTTKSRKRPAASVAKSSSESTPDTPKRGRAKPAPVSDAPKRAARGELAIVRSRRSRVTGTLVEIVNTTASDSKITSDEQTPWAARCVDHEHVQRFVTRAAARAVASDPSTWCTKCKRAAAKTTQ